MDESAKIIKKTNVSEIIDSGSIIIPYGEYLEFQINNLKFRIVFKKEQGKFSEFPSIGTKLIENDTCMEITLYNQDRSSFGGSFQKLHLGTFDDRKLWFMYNVLSINHRRNESDKILFYTWYYEI